MNPLLISLVVAMLSWLIAFPVSALLARWSIVDRPNARSNHQAPTVRGGGIAILLAILIASLFISAEASKTLILNGIALGLIAAISAIDDIRSVPGAWRFAVHVFAAGLAYIATFRYGHGGPHFGIWLDGIVAVGFVFWVVGHTNAFNFMDGINGLASMQAAITGLGSALLAGTVGAGASIPALYMVVLAGGAAGFLPHNFPRAKMFMGDVGSAPIGFSLAVLAFWIARDAGWALLPALLLLEANFVLDTVITLVRRTWRGERFGAPHRDHFYQRLVRSGWSHSQVTIAEMTLQILALGLLFIYVRVEFWGRVAIAIVVIFQWLLFFLMVDRRLTCSSIVRDKGV